jgi:hypothetical protein
MLCKALRLRQAITDGGIYTPQEVCAWKGPKPGLATLSDMHGWKDGKNGRRSCVSLGSVDWRNAIGTRNLPDLDRLALEHVHTFFAPYGLRFPFTKVEHKQENTFQVAAYWGKGDYALVRAGFQKDEDDPIRYAIRGKEHTKQEDIRKQHPTFRLLNNILAGGDAFPDDLTYSKTGLVSVNEWRQYQSTNVAPELKALRPGDSKPVTEHEARYNNTHLPVDDLRQYQRRRGRKRVHRGKPVALFERFGKHGIRAVHNAMWQDKLR